MCLPSLQEPNLNFNITCASSFKFQRETKIICCRDFRSQTTQILVILRCCFAENGSEMYKAYNALEEFFPAHVIFWFFHFLLPSPLWVLIFFNRLLPRPRRCRPDNLKSLTPRHYINENGIVSTEDRTHQNLPTFTLETKTYIFLVKNMRE